jgi:hypothetical protein
MALVLCLFSPIHAVASPAARTEITFTYAPAEPDYIVEFSGSWTQGDQNGLIITCSASFSKFVGVKVDEVLLDADKYTAVSGSTIVTLKPEYLATLSAGEHSIELLFTDGSVQTRFAVFAPGGNNSGGSGNGGGDTGNNTPERMKTPDNNTGDDNAGGVQIDDEPEKDSPDDTIVIVPDDTPPLNGLPEGPPNPSDEYPVPLGDMPQTGATGILLTWLLTAFGTSLIGIGVCMTKRPKKSKQAK